jgi:hypothetical protein
MSKSKYNEAEMIGALKQMEARRSAAKVGRELERIVAERGVPEAIRCDNGPQFTSRNFWRGGWNGRSSWYTSNRDGQRRTRMRRVPREAADECLNANWFGNLFDARARIGAWKVVQEILISCVELRDRSG